MLAILLIPAALCYTFGRMIRDTRQGWALLAAMTLVFVVLLAADYALEAPGNPVLTKLGVDQVATADQSRRQHGGQGTALRRRQLRAVGGRHHLRVERLGQLDARLVHAARGNDPDVADAAGRSDLRRRRLGPVRDDHVRDRHRLHRRPDDRPHARVPRQEDRRVRDQDGVGGDPAAAAAGALRHRAGA